MSQISRTFIIVLPIALIATLGARTANIDAWRVYNYQAGTFTRLPSPHFSPHFPLAGAGSAVRQTCPPPDMPPTWQVLNALHTDLTRDGAAECTLLVWRPWQDWAIMRWSDTPSPIAAHRDAHGDSAHIVLIEPSTYRELWAGSALALPIIQIAAGDVDGDGGEELVALEGDYVTGRDGPALHVAVWRWNGFGFTLAWRSRPDRLDALALADLEKDGTPEILVR